jgi:F-type H+-transporting ATPase subunit delta
MTINKRAKREAKQLFRVCVVNGVLDENRVREVVQLVSADGHRNYPAILSQLLRLVRLEYANHTANIESATPLQPDLQAAVQSSLARVYGPGLTTVFTQRPSLIGGMRIQVGCDVYDRSVLAGLTALEKRF